MIPFVLVASSTTSAPKVQVVTHLVCKTLRPEYTDRSGSDPTIFASDDEETRLCNADPVVQAASAEFLAGKYSTRHRFRAHEVDPFVLESNYDCNWCSDLLNYRVLGISKLSSHLITHPAPNNRGRAWFQRSDRKGRINTLRICLLGNLITDLTYLLVYSFLKDRRGAYWFLLIAPFFEGSLGGTERFFGGPCASTKSHRRPERRFGKYSRLCRRLYPSFPSVQGFFNLSGIGVYRHSHWARPRQYLDPADG